MIFLEADFRRHFRQRYLRAIGFTHKPLLEVTPSRPIFIQESPDAMIRLHTILIRRLHDKLMRRLALDDYTMACWAMPMRAQLHAAACRGPKPRGAAITSRHHAATPRRCMPARVLQQRLEMGTTTPAAFRITLRAGIADIAADYYSLLGPAGARGLSL